MRNIRHMIPAWAAVTIALGASAIGALAGFFGAYMSLRIAQLNLEHQASEAWRSRQLAAAEDFSALWVETLSGVGAVRGAITSRVDPAAPLSQLAEKHAETGAKLMRLGLLFGADSPARAFARDALSATNHASAALEDLSRRRPEDVADAEREDAVTACNEHLSRAQGAHREFVRVAHNELRTAALTGRSSSGLSMSQVRLRNRRSQPPNGIDS